MLEMLPFGRGRNIFAEMDRLERALLQPFADGELSFRTDITEKENCYIIRAELPGFKKEDITVDVKEGSLTIKAERSSENETKEGEHVLRREIRSGTFVRSFGISHVDEENISAKYENGMLELELPKETQPIPQSHTVQIQ